MGKGRKPQSPELRILKGSPGAPLPRSTSGAPPCPEHLDDTAREEWHRITSELDGSGLLARVDRAALELYTVAYSRWRQATADIASSGFCLITDLGGVKSNPAVAVARAAETLMARLLLEFGATPAARLKVRTAAEKPKDALSEFLGRRKV